MGDMARSRVPYALHRAVERREETSPDAEVAPEDGGAGFNGYNGADASFAIGRVTVLR